MPLPASWTDHLFARLSVRYGAAFLRQWPDADPAHVKADWSDVLDGTSGDAIAYALRYLPAAPPNALQFRDICRRAPVLDAAPQLDAPPIDREGAARAMAMIRQALAADPGGLTPAQRVICNLERIAQERPLTASQRFVLASCRRQVSGDPINSAVTQSSAMIPRDVLPPGMREPA